MQIDYIIVGQGLAGSVLGYRLIEAGYRVCVLDDGHRSSSTTVAAGIVNPVTGKRLAVLEGIEELLAEARRFYEELQGVFGVPLFHDREILRVCKSEEEIALFKKKCELATHRKYLSDYLQSGSHAGVKDPYGSFWIYGGGYLDTAVFLNKMRAYFKELGAYRYLSFDYEDILIEPDGVRYGEIEARSLVFAEGYKVIENPYFSEHEWAPAKGDILDIKWESDVDYLVNQGKWLLPVGKGRYRAGSTFEWDDLSGNPSSRACEEVMSSLEGFVEGDLEIVGQQAGVRPSTRSAKPALLRHGEHHELSCFNGFGSRGSLLVPKYSLDMIELLKL